MTNWFAWAGILMFIGHQAAPIPAIKAVRAARDTAITVTYPAERVDVIHACVVSRRVNDDSYEPRWCWMPDNNVRETFVIPAWPPAQDLSGQWEAMVFIQWRDTPEQQSDFSYAESGWVAIEEAATR